MGGDHKSMRGASGRLRAGLFGLGIVTLGFSLLYAAQGLLQRSGLHLHTPDLSLVAAAAPVIQVHIAGAVTALLIGSVLLAGVKGSRLHKRLGWIWVAAMALTAASSLFIKVLHPGHFSLIHLLSGWTLIALPMGVFAIRRGNIAGHRRTMTAMFVGGLLIAGLFTFLPGRLMWRVFLG